MDSGTMTGIGSPTVVQGKLSAEVLWDALPN